MLPACEIGIRRSKFRLLRPGVATGLTLFSKSNSRLVLYEANVLRSVPGCDMVES